MIGFFQLGRSRFFCDFIKCVVQAKFALTNPHFAEGKWYNEKSFSRPVHVADDRIETRSVRG